MSSGGGACSNTLTTKGRLCTLLEPRACAAPGQAGSRCQIPHAARHMDQLDQIGPIVVDQHRSESVGFRGAKHFDVLVTSPECVPEGVNAFETAVVRY